MSASATRPVLRPFNRLHAWLQSRVGASEIALAVVLVCGLGLRVWLIHAWRPAFLGYPDSVGYIDAAALSGTHGLLFWNPYRPAGYPLFLTWLHGIHGGLAFVIDVQHLMGLTAGVLLYFSIARFVRSRWVALLPALVVALSGTEIYLEHAALSEALYTFLVVLGLWCAARSIDSTKLRQACWLGAAGALIGLATPVRTTALTIAPVLVLWALLTRRALRTRLVGAAVVVLGFVLALGAYLVYEHAKTGAYQITRTAGETLYARTALFADCREFTPPAGTRGLCQAHPGQTGGATQYMFATDAPVVRMFGWPPDPRSGGAYTWPVDGELRAFAMAAVTHQPWDYLWTTLQGLAKYVDPGWGTPAMLEWSHSLLIKGLHDPQGETAAAPELAAYYPGHPVAHHDIGPLDAYANAARMEGPLTVIFVLLMIVGMVRARGRTRAAAGLFGWVALAMILTPVAVLAYGVRYATPSYGPLAAAAAIGVDELIVLARARRWSFRRPPRILRRGRGAPAPHA